MKKVKRILAVILCVLMLCGVLPSNSTGWLKLPDFSMKASAATNTLEYGDESGITRAEWLYDLTVIFDMAVSEEQLPDNYFSDLEESCEYYYEILSAVQFGVIDIAAGEDLRPNDYVTRDFAASTLNFCLGYQLDENFICTFSDSDAVSSPESAQIALNRKWFPLISGTFSPDTLVTPGQVEFMLNDAEEVLSGQIVDENYENTYEFADDVIVIPEDVTVSEDESGVISITNCPKTISQNDKFAVYFNGIPVVYTAVNISKEGNITRINTKTVDSDDAFADVDAQGIISTEDIEIIPADGVEMEIDEEQISTFSTRSTKKIQNINFGKKIKLADGVETIFSVSISNPYIEYKIKNDSAYITLNGDTKISYGVDVDAVAFAGKSGSITIFTANIGGIGSFDVDVNYSLKGSAYGTVKGYLVAGLDCSKSSGIRAVKSFSKSEYYSTVDATADVSLKATLGITKVPIVKGYVYAKIGANANLNMVNYSSGSPSKCASFSGYLYANYGVYASADIGLWSDSYSKNFDIYTKSNSPVRIYHHYEDGVLVSKCNRGSSAGSTSENNKYFTTATSAYSGSGWSGYNGAYGLTKTGEPVILFDYEENDDGGIAITQYNGNSSYVSIPSTIDGYTVTSIGASAFEYKNLSCISIPNTITNIGYGAFRECRNLREVVIPNTVTEIGSSAFYGCSNLSSVKMSDCLIELGELAFGDCDSLTKIYIPKSLQNAYSDYWGGGPFDNCDNLKTVNFEKNITKIPENLFDGCTGLENIVIPNTVTEIGSSAFYGCSNLSSVKMSDCLIELGKLAFGDCDSLTKIYIPKSLQNAYSDYWGGGSFDNCDNLKTVNFEKNITKIPENLFDGCTGLENIVIPNTVTEIGSSAFYGCSNLSSVEIPDTVTEIGSSAFYGCSNLSSVKMSDCLIELGELAFGDCDSLTKIYIPKSLQNAYSDYGGGGPFGNCDNLKTVNFEKNITKIPENLFDGCTGLENIVIPNTVTEIGSSAFYGCSNLSSVEIPDSVTKIGSSAFSYCASITNISIPDSVTEIGSSAFYGCSNLSSVEIPDSVTKIGSSAFSYCASITNISIPDSVTEIGNYAFDECTSLEEVNLSENITEINTLFYGCTSLKCINIPEKVNEIGTETFYNCTSLETVNFPENSNLKYLYSGVFEKCSALKSIKLPKGLKYLGDEVFWGCSSLEEVIIPDYTVMEIYSNTFMDCPALASIVLPKGITTIGSQAFMNGTGLVNVTIPSSVTEIDSTAFSYPEKMVISGVEGSFAEEFADDYGFEFKDISVPSEGIALKDFAEYIVLDEGETWTPAFEIYPENSTDIITLVPDENDYIVDINGLDISGANSGDTVIKATTSSGLSYEFTVHVRYPRNIEVINLPSKTKYNIGEELDLSGLKVQVNYHDNSTKEVTNYTVSGFDSSKEGENNIVITWYGKDGWKRTTEFKVNIVDPRPKVTEIYIETMPQKINYELREALDLTGMIVKAKYTDGSDVAITDYTVTGYNLLKKGVQSLTVMYNGKTTTFTVMVGVTIDTLIIDKVPSKTIYHIGDKLNTTGLVVKALFSDNSQSVIDNGLYSLSGFNSLTEGTKTITVTYSNKTVYFNVTIKGTNHSYNNACDTSCNICGATRTIRHNYAAATCTKPKTCKVCGATSGSKLTHKSDSGTVTKKATCTTTGTKSYKCTLCKATVKTESIAKIAHTYTTTTTKATLSKNGKVVKKCKVCGKVASTITIKYAKSFKLSTTSYTYNGKVKTPSVTVKDSAGKTLKKNTDYTVTYKNNKNVGTATVTITMKGKYTGTKKLTFKINPAGTKVSKLTAGKKSLTVNILKKSTQVTGYEIQYSTSKSFKGGKTKAVNYKTTKVNLKSLKAKKTYYARVRTYKTVNGKKYYSGWSAVKSVKTK